MRYHNFLKIFLNLRNNFWIRIVFYYLVLLFVASLLLIGPWFWENDKSINFLDSFYLATSALSTTGLTIYDVGKEMTFFGQLIIFVLIFAGGFGLIFFKIQLFKTIRYWLIKRETNFTDDYEQYFERGYFNPQTSRKILKIGFFYLMISYFFGFVCLSIYFASVPIENLDYQQNSGKMLWSALFHSVSATNNAGFDIMPGNSLTALEGHYFVQIVLIFQFIIGGLGFVVFFELWNKLKAKWTKVNIKVKLSFFSKMIVVFYIAVIVISISLITIFQAIDNKIQEDEDAMRIVFNTLSARSAGFSTVEIGDYFNQPSKYLLLILMWIGCAPLSTGGGIKITTFVIMFWAIFGKSDNRNNLRLFKRNVAITDIAFVYKIGFFSLLLIAISTTVFMFDQKGITLLDAFFYANSTLGNAGLTTIKITKGNNLIALKIVSIIVMLIGQIGLAQTIQRNRIGSVQSSKQPYLVSQKMIF